jgi:chemotaxis protein MotB
MVKKDRNVLYVKLPSRMGWMVTFSDLTTLLLTFFIMLIAMSSMDSKTMRQSFGYFSSVAGPLQYPQEHELSIPQPILKPTPQVMELKREELSKAVIVAVKRLGIEVPSGEEGLVSQETGRGLAIRVPGDVLFRAGSASVRKEAEPVLRAVADSIKDIDVTVAIEGHTDNVGNDGGNWRLSLQRAISVADFFVYTLDMPPGRFCVAGYGRLKPIATNDTVTGREKNRRVEIILLKDRI